MQLRITKHGWSCNTFISITTLWPAKTLKNTSHALAVCATNMYTRAKKKGITREKKARYTRCRRVCVNVPALSLFGSTSPRESSDLVAPDVPPTYNVSVTSTLQHLDVIANPYSISVLHTRYLVNFVYIARPLSPITHSFFLQRLI
jgi:hypothetical protein